MSSFTRPHEGDSTVQREQNENRSPSPPPYSPLTPERTMPPLAPPLPSAEHQIPPPVPISESSDPDAIALRSALSVLQIQRLRSIQDVQTLNRQRENALADPEAFVKAVASGKVRTQAPQDTLGILGGEQLSKDGGQSDTSSDSEEVEIAAAGAGFENIPRAQSIVRCPPINWAKYRVVGEALDALHEQQRRQPTSGDVQQPEASTTPHQVAAPYNPWSDKLSSNSRA